MNKFYLLLYILLLTISSSSSAKDNYLFEYLNVSNGLSNNSVTRVIKDKQGVMWFASSEGIVKLDAHGFEYLKPSNKYKEFYSEDVETLELGSNNVIWVGTKSGGLASYDLTKDKFVSYNHLFTSITNNNSFLRVTSIKETSDGLLCIGTWANGFLVIDLAQNKLIKHKQSSDVIFSIQETNDKSIWYGSGGRLFRYDKKNNSIAKHALKPLKWITKSVYDKHRNVLFLGTPNGVFEYDLEDKSYKKLQGVNNENLKLINTLYLDKQGRLWVGTWKNGLYRSNPEKSHFTKIDLLPNDELNKNYEGITDVFIDDNLIWVTTTHGGVVKLIENRGIYKIANTFKKNIGLPDNNINSLIIDENDNQWIGTKNGGVGFKWKDNDTFTVIPCTQHKLISSFLEYKDKMYVGTSSGLFIFSKTNPLGTYQFLGNVKFRKIKSLWLDQTSKTLYIGLQQSGLAIVPNIEKIALNKITFYAPVEKKENYFGSDRVEHIVKGKNGIIWLGTFNGLYQMNTKLKTFKFIDLKNKFDFPSNIILSLLSADNGNKLYIGSATGLMVLDTSHDEPQFIDFYNKNSGLENDCINAIVLDSNKQLWLGLSKGISSINLTSNIIRNYTKEDGVTVSSINIGAVYKHKDQVYFGGQKGLLVFAPNFISKPLYNPNVYFSRLKINTTDVTVGEEVNGNIILKTTLPFTKKIALSYKDKVIGLSVNTSEYIDQKNVNFSYRILSISDAWIDNLHNPRITLTQLPVGENIIEIKACRSGECGDVNQLVIDVKPAPWFSLPAIVIYFLLIGFIIYSIFSFFIRKEKLESELKLANVEKEKEHELTEAKMNFFTNISHEIRTPLTLIHAPLEELLDENELPEKFKPRLQLINKNTNNLLLLINQLLDFRKMEDNKLSLSYSFYSIKQLINNKFQEFQPLAHYAGLTLEFLDFSTKDQLYKIDKEKVDIVINNLLSNAIKFTPKGKAVTVSLEIKNSIKVRVKDQGVGIPTEELASIFTRYYQVDAEQTKQRKGTGIGLSLSKSIIDLHEGEISVSSKYGEGSIFTFELPILATKPCILEENKVKEIEQDIHVTPYNEEKLHTLLLVDDNVDILNYLEEVFKNQYNVFKAENGVKALKLIHNQAIDVVVSDVMMPEMDGIELCQIIKSDPKISHIPVILLTANATTGNELKGLEHGANDYIRKPFNSKVIQEKIKNILVHRDLLIQFYKGRLQPKEQQQILPEKVLSEEEKLLQKAIDFIELNIDKEELTVEFLADHMCMSQSTLYRKIKSSTNNTIVGFIRSIRLKKAADLLLSTPYSLKEIIDLVGINDVRYFTKEFKKQYNVEPLEYRGKAVI
ncbi:ATP-binding protein [Flammeovirga kamogawensis]|uniref:histidine kinase n=1 Tax=Flammeovirga kamogawensis TaxID=373891 RepID=A0ABX8H3K0_9BACT|nr:ATP-binding protein [Flammeovirga kamogawensis]MBB6463157.1 signal transduction histidine kinase/ligand-binding sensor domain-containing protein/DNA-binding response OmpR family regulator [Flammeovirga kamogawensis]QWG10391.1 response regulator [Flammeovirga kamogawensis]TRX63901.1 response regulator [Flammeovirga kamogawensis]